MKDYMKILFILCLLVLSLPICFATNDADLNQTFTGSDMSNDMNLNQKLGISEMNDELLGEDESYNHIYVNSSASEVGNGSKESPYKELSSINSVFKENTVVHIADGYYKYNYNDSGQIINFMQIISNVKFIGESAENTTIDFSGKGIYAFIEWNPNIYFKDIKLFNTSVNLISYNGQAQYGGTLEAENVIFDSAKSIAYNGAYYIGGAISCSGQLKLTDCIFKNNTADRGGAIFALIGGELKNCTFINNKARFDGGAIFTPNYQMLVHDSKFINNTALREGGAIYSQSNTLLNNTDLRHNNAYSGGVVYIIGYQLVIHNSNFTNNYAISHGGTVIAINSPYFYIKGGRFINDTSNSSAGAIYSMYSKMFFYDSVFANCSSLIGGAICDLYSSAIFSNMNFTNNSATKGGAVYKMYNTTSINGSTFNSNKAHDGGGLYVDQVSAILNNLKFNNNTAKYGGDIYCLGNPNNINMTNVSSQDLFNMALLDLNQRPEKYDIFEIEDIPVVLDSRYDMRDHYNLTEVKDQLEQGNCWAFAAMGALESCILKANGTAYDFSEENLKNLVSRFSDYGNFASLPNSGGNFFMTIGYLASWLGPISEEEEIYSPNALSLLYNAVTHVQNVVFLPRMSYTDNDRIKEAIVKYGAVVTSMYYSNDYLASDKVSYYVNVKNLQTNHDVAIVGWDDNYPKEKFKTAPPENGAFIVRNSWGPNWGENGYFYVSYYDLYFTRVGNIFQPSFTFVLNDTNHYDKNYQHEIQISNFATLQAETTSLGIGNSFRAESDELVSAVSTYFSGDSNYTISIYVNGQLKHSQQGSTNAGYWTIPLTKYVPIKKDDTFDAMFIIINLNNQKPLLYIFEYSKNSRFAKNGISFYSDDYGKNWYNAFEKLGGVIPIKGFTKYGKLNTSIEVSGWDCNWTINKDHVLQVRVKDPYGDYIDYGNVTFLIDGEANSVKLVNFTANMTVLFTKAGEHNITVLFNAANYYYSSNVSKLITINPLNTVLSLSLSNKTLLVGEPLTATATVNATQGKILFYINNTLNKTVNVNSQGVASLVLNNLYYGSYNITAVFTDDKGTYLNSSNKTSFTIYTNTIIEVSGWDCNWTINRNVTLQIRVKDQFGNYIKDGNVIFLIDNKTSTAKIVNSIAKKTISFNQTGKHNITVLFNAIDYYNPSNVSKLITINPLNTVLSLSLNNKTLLVGEPLTATATVNATQGKILFYINNNLNKTVNINNQGVASLVLNNLYYGSYNITAVFTDDKGTYLNSSNKTSFTIYTNTIIEVSGWDCNWTINKNIILQIRVKDQFSNYIKDGNVIFLIDNKTSTAKIVNSIAKKTISFNQAGKHNITVLFNAANYYYSSNVSKLITINPANTVLSLSLNNKTLLVGEPLTATATVNATQGKILFYINNNLNKTVNINSQGVASLILNNLYYGSYNITSIFTDDKGTYLNSSNKTSFTIYTNTIIEVSGWDCNWTINNNYTLHIMVKDQFGKYIKDGELIIYIRGDTYNVKLIDSVANITVSFTQADEYDILVIFNSIDYYNPSNVSKLITINPANTVLSLSLSNKTLLVGEPLTATATVNATQGKILFYINNTLNKTVNVNSQGVASLVLNNLYYDSYNITAIFIDDKGTYLNSSDKSSFTVIYPIKIITHDLTKYYNESDRFTARIMGYDGKGISNQKVKFTIVNTTYEALTDSSGYAYLTASLQPGDYIVKTIYENLKESNLFRILPTILDKDMNISSSDIYDDESEVIGVALPKDATGNVITIVNNNKYSADVNNGIANIYISNLKDGNYNIEVIYSGDEKYNSVKGNTSFTVKKSQIHISAPDVTKYYHSSERFVVEVKYNDKPLHNARVTIDINGMKYNKTTDENGVASIAINLNSGIYNVTTECNSTQVYSTVTVKPTIAASDVTKMFKNETQYYAKFMNSQGNILKNTDVKFNINGVFYTRTTNDEGIARLNINLNPGEYILTAINPYNGEQHANTIKVLSPIVENHDLTKYYKNASQFTFKLLDNQGNPVGAGVSATININGVFYTRTTNASSYVNMNINLNPGTYIATINYNGLMMSNTIKVLPILSAKDVNMKYHDGTKFEAKLVDGQGKPHPRQTITFNINGVFYNKTTDNDGIARLNINLMAGKYIITSMYENGAAISNKITISS